MQKQFFSLFVSIHKIVLNFHILMRNNKNIDNYYLIIRIMSKRIYLVQTFIIT